MDDTLISMKSWLSLFEKLMSIIFWKDFWYGRMLGNYLMDKLVENFEKLGVVINKNKCIKDDLM